VRINGSVYEVVGVFQHDQGLFVGLAWISLPSFPELLQEGVSGGKRIDYGVHRPENVNVETAQGEVIQAMRRLRRIPAGKENDFELSSRTSSAIYGASSPARW